MPNVIKKITYAKKLGEGWDTEIELPPAKMQEIVIGWGSQKDSAKIDLPRANYYFDSSNPTSTPDISEEDLVRFYVAKNVSVPYTFTTDDLLFEGTVDTATQKVSEKGNIVSVSTFNFYEAFFDVELPYYEENLNFIEHAQTLLRLLQQAGTIIQWDSANPTLKKDGSTSLPKKALALDYTPAFIILEKLCDNEFTEDGQYYWYLSKDTTGQRKLSIRAKDNNAIGTIDETVPLQNISVEKGKDAVVNYVIYNVGIDLYNNTVEDFIFDASSIGKYGWKTHYLQEETGSIFSSLFAQEVTQNSSSFSFDSNGNLSDSFPTSYPYTFYFDSSVTAANDSDFNEELRIKALTLGEFVAQDEIDQLSKTQYIVNLNVPFSNDYLIGGLYTFNLPKLRNFDKQLRLKQITYSLNGMTLSFDQDVKDRE